MTTALSPVIASRLEKAAVDNGFDQELPREGDWLGFASTQCPLRIWLGTFGDAVFLAAFSHLNVARALGNHGTPMAAPLPKSASAAAPSRTSRRCTACFAVLSSSRRRSPTSCSIALSSRPLRSRKPPRQSAWSSNA
jgi:hypothetical protein